MLALTRPDTVPSQRTAAAAGLARRPDLDSDDGTGALVIVVIVVVVVVVVVVTGGRSGHAVRTGRPAAP